MSIAVLQGAVKAKWIRLSAFAGVIILPLMIIITQSRGGILALMPLDDYVDDPLVMMAAVEGDELDPEVETAYRAAIEANTRIAPPIVRIDRFDFYERTRGAFAIVMTGETAKYGNIILKKGVVPC